MELNLTQQEANKLIIMLKCLAKEYSIQLEDGCNGSIDVIAKSESRKFKLYYFYQAGNYHLNFHDCKSNLNLIRINLDSSFHKNADGEIIRGNRINIFNIDEFHQKNDGSTYMKAYPLPYKDIIKNSNNFIEVLYQLLDFINVENKNQLHLHIQTSLL